MEKLIQYIITGFLIIISIIGFILMGIDKNRAVRRQWRIPERTLLMIALIGGGLGSFLGMYTFRHKTKHIRFLIIVPLSAILYLILLLKLYHIV